MNQTDQSDNNEETEDEDYASFFLQPASSPYNIAEKVQQANIDLFNDNSDPIGKNTRVTFKDELASYEPESEFMTDDDVNSIESDPPETPKFPNNVINLNIFDILEDGEEINEEVIEEECQEEEQTTNSSSPSVDTSPKIEEIIESRKVEGIENIQEGLVDVRKNKNNSNKKICREPLVKTVECKNHCIEKLLDFDLSMSIKKLDIKEKPVICPLLKLQQRKCCEENRHKNLPCYNGFRSEYGLSSADLEKREKRLETIKLKEQKRRQLMDDYKNRKNRQNEAVFCQWLKDVARRKTREKISDKKESLNPNVISFPKVVADMERPKTANEFLPKQHIKRAKRPHTSSCVFIEVPPKILEKGIHIGDLLVTNTKLPRKKVHILTLSA